MKVLVVGGGGRCHAIVDALSRSEKVNKIWCAPGNAGISRQAEIVNIGDTDIAALADFAQREGVDLTVVGPESSLEAGIVDLFRQRNLMIFGPTKEAARIESSKEFAKELMKEYGIPTASYSTFDDYYAAMEYVSAGSFPTVLKYDGLAAGKGVVIAEDIDQARSALSDMLLDDKFGHGKVVIEQYLEGPEFSFMCFVSGEDVYPMPLAQDHKRAFEGDHGPNTGGMGAYSPVPFVTPEEEMYSLKKIMLPVAKAMAARGTPFTGVLYGGLIKTRDGIKVIEFNARFGDPETEVVLPRLESDLFDIFYNLAQGKPINEIQWSDKATVGIVMASKGYPGSYRKGAIIEGVDSANSHSRIYHMGTANGEGRLKTAGGRVLIAVGEAQNLEAARDNALEAVAGIECSELFFRRDIGSKFF